MPLLEEQLAEIVYPSNEKLYGEMARRYAIPVKDLLKLQHDYVRHLLNNHRERLQHLHGEAFQSKYFAMLESYVRAKVK